MKKAFRAAAIAAILLFALTFIGNAKIKSASAHLLFSSSVSVGGNESREVTLKSDDRIAIGSYLGEPIVWRVIETGGKTLLMSEKVLCFRAFDPSEDGIGSSDYFASPLRAWLNSESGFLSPENFSEFDLSLISPDKNGDSIFLPSKDMLKNISTADRRTAVAPAEAAPYAERKRDFPYKIAEDAPCCREFLRHGFTWGGHWKSLKDYQHFEKKQ